MSHTKPAAASDPAFGFSTEATPLDLALLREHDYGRSLMDRAQRQRATKTEFGDRAQALLQQAATSSLPQEAQLAALDQQAQQLADAERTQLSHRRLRERYDPHELQRNLQAIATIADSAQQRASLTQLQGSYAGFAFHPEIAQRMDRQFAELEPVVQRREQASLRAAVAAGRYAPTLSDARQLYPGRKLNTFVDPASRATVFVPEKFADPDLEAEAVQVIQNGYDHANATRDLTRFKAALDDEAVRQVSRIPGNRASVLYRQKLTELNSTVIPPENEPAATQRGDYYLGGNYSVRPRQTVGLSAVREVGGHLGGANESGPSERPVDTTPSDNLPLRSKVGIVASALGDAGRVIGRALGRAVWDSATDAVQEVVYRGVDTGVRVLPIGERNQDFLSDWITGDLPNRIVYASDAPEVADMRVSPGADALRDRFYKDGARGTRGFAYGTGKAALDTIINPLTAVWSSTSMQVGGFGGAVVTNNGDGTATFTIVNTAGTKSFFYHVVPDRAGTRGPMHGVVQVFTWTEPINPSRMPPSP